MTVTNSDIDAAKAKGNANNDWVLSHNLILNGSQEDKKDEVAYQDVVDKFQELYLGGLRDSETLIPSKALLSALAERFPCAIVTGRPREEAQYFLELHGIADLFQAIVCMEDTAKPKPDPAPVLLALQKLNCAAEGAVMLGDTVDDARAARAAGVTALGVMLPGAKDEAAKILAAAGADAVLSAGIHELASFLPKDVQESLTVGTTATTTTSASAAGEEIALRRTSAEQILSKEVTEWRATESPKIRQIDDGIVTDVKENGTEALLKYALRFGDIKSKEDPFVLGKDAM